MKRYIGACIAEVDQARTRARIHIKVLDQWAYLNGVELDFIPPNKPADKTSVKAFNGRFREERLNQSRFPFLNDVRKKVEK